MANAQDFRFIRCGNPTCNRMFRVIEIPKQCPSCHWLFRRKIEAETITDVILNALTRRTEKGYMDCDPHGWVTGEGLPMPIDLQSCITEESA